MTAYLNNDPKYVERIFDLTGRLKMCEHIRKPKKSTVLQISPESRPPLNANYVKPFWNQTVNYTLMDSIFQDHPGNVLAKATGPFLRPPQG
jgi:hypothetical protein